MRPYLAVSHIQHHRLQEGNHISTERKILIHTALRQTGKLRTFLHQLPCQGTRLLAFHQATCHVQPFDVRTQLFGKIFVVRAIDGHIRTDGTLRNGADVDTAQRSVGQHVAEEILPLADGRAYVVVEAHRHLLAHRCRTDARLSVQIPVIETQTQQVEHVVRVATARQVVQLLYLVHSCIEKTPLRICHTLHEGRTGDVRINALNHNPFRTLLLVLVRPLALRVPLPVSFFFHTDFITLADVRHDVVYRRVHTALTAPRRSHQQTGQRRLMITVVYVTKPSLIQVRTQ